MFERRRLVWVWMWMTCAVAGSAAPAAGVGDWWAEPFAAPATAAPADPRLGPPRTLNDANHPWNPPAPDRWPAAAELIRAQLLVATGHWPLPVADVMTPVVHGTIERDGYCIDNVSLVLGPTHRITGNVYRPTRGDGPFPGVLCPHGHWNQGRLYDAGAEQAEREIASGAEQFVAGARYPLQARMVHLARMGCVVFHYDMVGYGSSRGLGHREGFGRPEDVLHLRNVMGLQTWNSRRALDYLCQRPDVDPARLGITGASGGGTQTFVLGALDSRPCVAFPAVMVSTAMQGGCVCENASYLRLGLNNVAFAALFAPRPLGLSGANDWTVNIETRGLPELQQVYAGLDAADQVSAHCDPQFGHNYNQVARERMYAWFRGPLGLASDAPLSESDFEPVPPAELDFAPPPSMHGEGGGEAYWREVSAAPMRQAASFEEDRGLARLRGILSVAADVMFGAIPPRPAAEVVASHTCEDVRVLHRVLVGRDGARVPVTALVPSGFQGAWVLWVEAGGREALRAAPRREAVQALLAAGRAVVTLDALAVAESSRRDGAFAVNETCVGYTFGYNRPLVAERVRDVGLVARSLRERGLDEAGTATRSVVLVGSGGAGAWALLARGWLGDALDATIADLQGRGLGQVTSLQDPDLLPGALKYGGVGGLVLARGHSPVFVFGAAGVEDELVWLERAMAIDPGLSGGVNRGTLDLAELTAIVAAVP